VYGQAEVGSTSSTYATQVLKGTYDLFVSKGLTKTNKFIIARDVRVDADTVRDFDFAVPEAFVPDYYKIDLQGLQPGEGAFGSIRMNNTYLANWNAAPSLEYPSIPADKLKANELYQLDLSANIPSTGMGRGVSRVFKTPSSTPVALPPHMTRVEVVDTSQTPYLRFKTTWGDYAKAQVYMNSYSQWNSTYSVYWQAVISAEWMGKSSLHSYELPDLSAVNGWDSY